MNGGISAITAVTRIVIKKPEIDLRYGRAKRQTRRNAVLPIFVPVTADLSRGIK